MDTKAATKPKEITEKAPPNWREVMSRSQKAFRNRWNTVISGKPKTPKTKKDETNS